MNPAASTSLGSRYDPKVLLNPKAVAKEASHVKSETSGSPGTLGEKNQIHGTMQFSNSSWNQSEVYGEKPINLGSMIERVHQVGSRDHEAMKRRKIQHYENDGDEADQSGARKKSEFSSGNTSGELGKYITEKQQPSVLADSVGLNSDSEVIDLTSEYNSIKSPDDFSSEEDLIVVGQNQDREVCLGRIDNARVNAHLIPSPKMVAPQGIRNQWPPMKVSLLRPSGSNDIIRVIDPTGKDFGTVDKRTAIALAPVMDSSKTTRVRVQARLPMRNRKPYEYPKQQVSDNYEMLINVYAPKSKATSIGKFFSQKMVFFKQPLSSDHGVEIMNPHTPKDHTPKNAGIPKSNVRQLSNANTSYVSRTIEEVRNDVFTVFDSLKQSEDLPEHEPSPFIITPLLKHQKQALNFMLTREKNPDGDEGDSLWQPRIRPNGMTVWYNVISGHESKHKPEPVLGGILADVMGLGKTLNILALVVATKNEAEKWSNETPLAPLTECEPKLVMNSKSTLVICPLSTIKNWIDQINTHLKPGIIKYYVYHGQNRTRNLEQLKHFDVIFSPYGTISREIGRNNHNKAGSPIAEFNWFRIVLDEAHIIRSQSTRQSKAICSLAAQRRWAVTGTPVQNKLEDLGALVKFLRVRPFDETGGFTHFFVSPMKTGDQEIIPKLRLLVDSITLRRLKDLLDLPSRTETIVRLQFSDSERTLYEWFARDSENKVKAMTLGGKKNLGGRAYAHVLRAIVRMRLLCAHGQELLSDEDMELTKGIDMSNAIDLENEDDSRPRITSKQACEMLHIMREANADFCPLCSSRIGPTGDASEVSSDEYEEDSGSEDQEDILAYLTPCNHLICPKCIETYRKELKAGATPDKHNYCKICGTYITISMYEITQSEVSAAESNRNLLRGNFKLSKQLSRYVQPHTKTKALIRALHESAAWSIEHPDLAPIKSVVFSGWTSHLNLIQIALMDEGIHFTRLDGSMTRKMREENLETFASSKTVCVILISLGAGGLGLNLTIASRVYMMEPQFNPAAEAQAIERVHRLGQTRDVLITKFIMTPSFEEKILKLQQKKQRLAELSIERVSKEEMARQRLDELKDLFR